MSEDSLYQVATTIRRSWRERLFSRPWRPWISDAHAMLFHGQVAGHPFMLADQQESGGEHWAMPPLAAGAAPPFSWYSAAELADKAREPGGPAEADKVDDNSGLPQQLLDAAAMLADHGEDELVKRTGKYPGDYLREAAAALQAAANAAGRWRDAIDRPEDDVMRVLDTMEDQMCFIKLEKLLGIGPKAAAPAPENA